MTTSSRRGFLKGSASLAAGSFVATLQALQMRNAHAQAIGSASLVASPYGPVAPVLDLTTHLPLLQLPEGFTYRSFGWTGDPMADSQPCPGSHDGMAVVQSLGGGSSVDVVLVRNHERGQSSTPIVAPAMYDTAPSTLNGRVPGGGTTHLRFRGRQWVSMEPSLGGTLTNCAGGPTPWGTWLTCEETGSNLEPQGGRKHGYVFEVRAKPGETTGRPIVAMGRFSHEAVAVDPLTNFAYLTEDNRNKSGFYRFKPSDASGAPGAYEAGGTLQMARVVGRANADLIVASKGERHRIEWVDIANPDADPVSMALPDFAGTTSVAGPFAQGWAAGGLRMSRGEGIWHRDGKLFIVDTSTGINAAGMRGNGEGAVWEYDIEASTLTAVFVSLNALACNNPDNITVSPRGGLLLCEDGGGVTDPFGFGDRLTALTADGDSYVFAKNNVVLTAEQIGMAGKLVGAGDYRDNEFCGACFDPAGKVLFVNIQTPGITFAIWGPWARGNL
jgi:secreted PhoX family phosphatase